jgi:CO/xanthine dehydrogenase FAD-binding subunit
MQDFDYISARSVDEAVALLSSNGGVRRVLAGGTDLLVQLRERRVKASLLVDIKHIPEVNELTYNPLTGLRLGAGVPCYRICQEAVIAKVYPGFMEAVALIGGTQIQGRASVGGNLCNASPAADSVPALIVHRATCLIAGPKGTRYVPVENFCTAPGQTILEKGEFLVALHLPPPEPGFGAAYLRFTPRNEMDIAIAGAGASVVLDPSRSRFKSARIALAAIAPTPLFVTQAGDWLVDKPVSEQTIEEAAQLARAGVQPIDDLRGTILQRKHLVGVLTRRALNKAISRSRAQEK